MSDFKLNSDHDLDITDQAMSLVEDTDVSPAAIAQEVNIALRFHQGEWPLNILVGIPYLTQVFIKNPSLAALNVLFTQAVRSVAGIVSAPEVELELDNETRILAVDFEARAQGGGVIEDRLAVVF